MRPQRRLVAAALAAAVLTAAGCTAALRQATPQDAVRLAPRWPGTTLESLQRGRSLYVRRCSGCHTLFLPETQAAEDWPRLVDEMAAKGRLGLGERDDVVRFLVAVASDSADASVP